MFHYSLTVIDEPKMSEIRILSLCHKKSILVDIYRQSLLNSPIFLLESEVVVFQINSQRLKQHLDVNDSLVIVKIIRLFVAQNDALSGPVQGEGLGGGGQGPPHTF